MTIDQLSFKDNSKRAKEEGQAPGHGIRTRARAAPAEEHRDTGTSRAKSFTVAILAGVEPL